MRIELRDEHRRKIGRIEVDPALRPTRVGVADSDREVFLNWDSAVDDGGHLRCCVACGCRELFREKSFPQITTVVVLAAFVGAVVGALGFATTPPVLIAMGGVLVLDVAILILAERRLVCYRCRTSYHGLPIARYHRTWDRALAERFPPPAEAEPDAAPTTAMSARVPPRPHITARRKGTPA